MKLIWLSIKFVVITVGINISYGIQIKRVWLSNKFVVTTVGNETSYYR